MMTSDITLSDVWVLKISHGYLTKYLGFTVISMNLAVARGNTGAGGGDRVGGGIGEVGHPGVLKSRTPPFLLLCSCWNVTLFLI